jgi:hypothetical protein
MSTTEKRDRWLSVDMGMVAWGLNIPELRQAIVGGKGRRRQRRKTSAGIFIADGHS